MIGRIFKFASLLFLIAAVGFLSAATTISLVQPSTCSTGQFFNGLTNNGQFTCASTSTTGNLTSSYAILSSNSSQFSSSTPVSVTAITGLSVTVGPYSSATEVLVSQTYRTGSSQTNFRSQTMLDGTSISNSPAYTMAQDNNFNVVNTAVTMWPVQIPGDNATHTIASALSASGSTAGLTLEAGSSITVIHP